jgi:hypothetical protein
MADSATHGPRRLDWRLIAAAVALLVVGSAAALLLSRQRQEKASAAAIESAIHEYNDKLMQAIMVADPRLMKGVIGPEEDQRLSAYMTKLKGEGRVIGSRLDRLEVTDVQQPNGSSATVRTEEDWRYQDYDPRTRKPTGPIVEEHQRLTYHLALVKGRWRVELVEVAEESAPDG